MNTSYFSKSATHPKAVSIALKNPPYFTGRHFKILAPLKGFYNKFRRDMDVIEFTEIYQKKVLDTLNPRKIYDQLGEDAVLLCWEGKGKFCHRTLVAKWFYRELGIKVNEL